MKVNALSKVSGAVPARVTVGVMMFTACMLSYMLRVNMSINILDMVQTHTTASNTSQQSECLKEVPSRNMTSESLRESSLDLHPIPEQNAKYNWSVSTQGIILGAYFWGYTITSLPGGPLAERWGPRLVVGVSSAGSALFTLLSPAAASLHPWLVVACRFVIGSFGGVLYPSLHSLVANWAPPEEKGKFIAALMGGTFGTIITWSLCGVLISTIGWQWAFYIPGLIGLIWTILWFILVADSPKNHPRISDKEKSYILDCIGESVDVEKPLVPLKDVLMSIPFWAFTILHFGNLWGLYFLLTAGPKFIAQVLGFNLSQAGFISGVPYITRMIMGFVFGAISDFIRRKGYLSVTAMRKTFCLFSHFIPGLLLILLSYIGCNPLISVLVITASLGINGAATVTNLQNHQDLAPNYAGTLYGIANCIGSTTGFITPLITSYFTKERNGFEEWRYIFFIGAAVYFISGIIFIIFGTGNTQSWNKKSIKPNNNNSKSIDNLAFEMDNNTTVK